MDFRSGVITLLTDFSEVDAYVAAMKGVILSHDRDLRIVDITHQIPPQDVLRAGWVLREAVPWYPAGTVHIVVVDPGVGTSRTPLVAEVGDQIVVAPDNGVISALLETAERWRCFAIERSDLCLAEISNTFHGRDIFAPVGAALASGKVMPEECGSPLEPIRVTMPVVERREGHVRGEVMTVDGFGNLITNIEKEDVFREGPLPVVRVDGQTVDVVVRTYGEGTAGQLVALVGSSGFLEIAVVDGSAAGFLGNPRGEVEVIHPGD